MNGWFNLFNYSTHIAGLALMIIALVFSVITRKLRAASDNYFIVIFSLFIPYIAFSLINLISESGSGTMLLSKVSLFIASFISTCLATILTHYIIFKSGETASKEPLLIASVILWFIYSGLLVYTQFSESIYYYTPDNVYHRGPLYPILLIPPALIMLINLILIFKFRKKITKWQFVGFLTYIVIPLLAMVLQVFIIGYLIIVFASSISALFMFILMLKEQVDSYLAQAELTARQQASIVILQMRPHFVYNTMMSIYYLCSQDPKKAQQVTLDFTTYLRNNFTAVAKESPIPFTEELDHAKAYLAVEKVRYEDHLFVKFDTEYTSFHIPPLTLQPVVENCVKHGCDPDLKPLHILVRTRKVKGGSLIIVEDDGPGYKAPTGDDIHIGLDNLRKRVSIMCGGGIKISPREEGGTIVYISIPDKR